MLENFLMLRSHKLAFSLCRHGKVLASLKYITSYNKCQKQCKYYKVVFKAQTLG